MRATYGYAGHTLAVLVWSLATSEALAQASPPPTAATEATPEAPLAFGIAPTLGGASGMLRLRL
jgi:hypothetical protein